VDIDARTLSCWNENAWDDAPLGANTLRQQLRIMERAAQSLFSAGSLGSVSKNSASQSYAGAGFGRFSVAQIQQGFRILIEMYDWILKEANWVYASTGTCHDQFVLKYPNFAEDPDQAVYDIMVIRLQPVDSYEIDLSYLRLQPTLGYYPQTW
jgi:hypothetical protein